MKKFNVILLIFSVVLLVALWLTMQHYQQQNPPYSPAINRVLFMSGNNRSELEKTLEHYSENLADSLKLKAAEFLIINMPGKYSEFHEAEWNNVATVYFRWRSSSNKQRVIDVYKLPDKVKQFDIEHITAHFLINNIDLAFEAWQTRPWNKHVSFDVFCEEILPYRVGAEQLEYWRDKALASFADLDSLLNKPETTAVDAANVCV